ncbi:acyl-CoA N-acyltransferase [Echria macrotheca]|uniref:N-alpha-acetyltransferase 40 n=1 Tax=Echria macrotheca TaxID=438768 RepID=A0AAJ0BB00_9PEZI|nr:acyl-CoA N-acyltransferase [Echria macrotheca]
MKPKRRRAPTSPLEVANRKSDPAFITDYLSSGPEDIQKWMTEWTHPRTNETYDISLISPGKMTETELQTCLDLIEETSGKDYANSAGRWHPDKKLVEMKSPELRYILVRSRGPGRDIRGFTSLMPTYEAGEPVVYCYEIHLKPDLQGTGLGTILMNFHTTVATNLPPITKVMLTCFLSNRRGLEFYHKLGFQKDDISPRPRRLRFGKVFQPDYVIMSKQIRPDEAKLSA